MEIKTGKDKNTVIVYVKGRMDALTSVEFEKRLTELISAGENRFVINLNQLDFISSAGLSTILKIAKQLKKTDGKIFFTELQDTIKDVFKISGFGTIFEVFETEKEALVA
jgi:anti-anti-sigma factor